MDEINETRPLFKESAEEKKAREAFYEIASRDAKRPEQSVIRALELKLAGSLRPQRVVQPRERITVIIHDEDGEVLASGEGVVMEGGFKYEQKDGYLIVTRGHKVKLD